MRARWCAAQRTSKLREEWLDFIRSPAGLAIFERYGFKPYVGARTEAPFARDAARCSAPDVAVPTAIAADAAPDRGESAPAAAAPAPRAMGPSGEGNTARAGFPRLAGLPAAYQMEQLAAFADGTRQSAVMAPLARALGRMIERSSRTITPRSGRKRPKRPRLRTGRDDRLALHGRWSEEIPACVQCHGDNGGGIGAGFPPLAAQPSAYLAAQLRAWQKGTRRGDSLGLMRRIASQLSDADVVRCGRLLCRRSGRRRSR